MQENVNNPSSPTFTGGNVITVYDNVIDAHEEDIEDPPAI